MDTPATRDRPHDEVIRRLESRLAEDPGLEARIVGSLHVARAKAEHELNPDLFRALEFWPTDIPEYAAFLRWFARWSPRQSSDKAWLAPGTDEHQEVYDRLCHFYWLIDQPSEPGGPTPQSDEWFSRWLIDYANEWGVYLDTPESFSDEILQSFINDSPRFEVGNSMIDGRPNNPSGWLTFNQFFARELNPGLRPIYAPQANTRAVMPADCTYKAQYSIASDSTIPAVRVKKTHAYASIPQLLEGSQYRDAFAGGRFVHYFLGPYSYHRFHTPVSGVVRECYSVHGKVYLDVNLAGGQFDAPDSSQGGYEFGQARGVITIDTAGSPYGDVGVVAVIPIGMAQVSSVRMTMTPGQPTLKGDEFGYFLFGGSDIIVLFQEGVAESIDGSLDYRRYGQLLATCRERP